MKWTLISRKWKKKIVSRVKWSLLQHSEEEGGTGSDLVKVKPAAFETPGA